MPILSNFPGGAGSGSGGLTLAAVSGITTQVSAGKVYVKWTDPDDLVVAGSTIVCFGRKRSRVSACVRTGSCAAECHISRVVIAPTWRLKIGRASCRERV